MWLLILAGILGITYYNNIDLFWILIALLFNPVSLAIIVGCIIFNHFFSRSVWCKDQGEYY